MTLVTTVSSGDFGLDVLLGGGLRLVERVEGKRSATVLVRGSAGVGKSIWSLQLAKALAEALEGDVLVACVEILPREVVAQASGARRDLTRIAALPNPPPAGTGPAVVVGLLPDMEPGAVDLVQGLERLRAEASSVGARPAAIVVDSLIQDYLGEPTRLQADGLMKYAGSEGLGLVLCEEQLDEFPSPWVFAADTVIELASGLEAPRTGRARTLQVRKHRFGASVSGRHSFRFSSGSPEVAPNPASWPVQPGTTEETPPHRLSWVAELSPMPADTLIHAHLTCIVAEDRRTAALLAGGLVPDDAGIDVVFMVDALGGHDRAQQTLTNGITTIVHMLSPTVGPGFELRRMMRVIDDLAEARANVARFILGDMRSLLSAPEGKAWVHAIQTFAGRVAASKMAAPVICFMSGEGALSSGIVDVADANVLVETPIARVSNVARVLRRGEPSVSVMFANLFEEHSKVPDRVLLVTG